jgi:hypothetical protein
MSQSGDIAPGLQRERLVMSPFSPVTDADLSRARSDPTFRQRLLEQNLDALLAGMKKLRGSVAPSGAGAKQLREGVELAVRLAELIQNADHHGRIY